MRTRRQFRLCLLSLLGLYRLWLIQCHTGWGWNRRRVSIVTGRLTSTTLLSSSTREPWNRKVVKTLSFLRGGGDDSGEEKDEYDDREEIQDDNEGNERHKIDGVDVDHGSEPREASYTIASSQNGEDDGNETFSEDQSDDQPQISDTGDSQPKIETPTTYASTMIPQRQNRHSSDVILDLSPRSVVFDGEASLALRDLITQRTGMYINELEEVTGEILNMPLDRRKSRSLPHPRKLLHYLAPKIPAIKQSPDVNLRIHSSRSDIDPGCAACILGMLAHSCELYDNSAVRIGGTRQGPVSFDLKDDRRFEQLVECVISGINIEKRIRESEARDRQIEDDKAANKVKKQDEGPQDESEEEAPDIEDVLDEEDAQYDEGIGVRDACRAAFGIAVLGTQQLSSLGGVAINDLLLALSLRVRELLPARLQLLRVDDILDGFGEGLTTEERLYQLSEELAQDTASAVWAFACVRALTGCRSSALFEAGCSILCSQPIELRQKAQESGFEHGDSIGSSDVIDRLARSEESSENTQTDSSTISPSFIEEKDVLLDWLSPTEVTDVLWGIALHGSSNDTLVKDDLSLTVTAASLRETASDRIIEWLQHDLGDSKQHAESDGEDPKDVGETLSEIPEGREPDDVDVAKPDDVVMDSSTPEKGDTTETIEDNDENGFTSTMQEVQVVDAASLLASYGKEDEIQVDTEVLIAPASLIENGRDEIEAVGNRESFDDQQIFNSHDLVSIAWSLTELNDTSKSRIVGMVLEQLSRMGASGVTTLSGGDLANLAWSISKETSSPSATSLSLTDSMVTHALRSTKTIEVLDFLQPPELARLMWAVAWTVSTIGRLPTVDLDNRNILNLADKALATAAEASHVFNTEEMARILFAWLELSYPEYTNLDFKTSAALGRILSIIEISLQRWEKGDMSPTGISTADLHAASSSTTLFGSLFGRSRFNPLMEHAVINVEEDDDTRSHRPKLRDLNLDPSTLIKIAQGVNRLARSRDNMADMSGTITRVILRLMSSKSGKLLRVCSSDDIARLCEAASLCKERLDVAFGYFSRQLIQVLNEGVDMSSLTSQQICTLIWSLAKLGIRCSANTDDKHKLSAEFLSGLLRELDVSTLDLHSLNSLSEVLHTMKYFPIFDLSFASDMLQVWGERIRNDASQSDEDLCETAESVALFITEKSLRKDEPLSGVTETEAIDRNSDEPQSDDDSPERMDSVTTNSIMSTLASSISNRRGSLSASQIRRVLAVYCLLPFQADEMVDVLADEISSRMSAMQLLSSDKNVTLESLAKTAEEKSEAVQSALFEETSSSMFDSLRSGLASFFSSDEKNDEAENREIVEMTENARSLIQESLVSSSAMSRRLEMEQRALQTPAGKIVKEAENAAALDLGKAQEFLAAYRRLEFDTDGIAERRKSRYDQLKREEIAKRVLSRLLP